MRLGMNVHFQVAPSAPGSWKTSVDDFWSGESSDLAKPTQPLSPDALVSHDLALTERGAAARKADRALASPTYESIHNGSLDSLLSLIEAAFPERAEEAAGGRGDQDQSPAVSGRMPGRRVFTTLPTPVSLLPSWGWTRQAINSR